MEENNYELNNNNNANIEEGKKVDVENSDSIVVENVEPEIMTEKTQNIIEPEAHNDKEQRTQVYYTESYKKPKEKKNAMWQLILVAVFSSILTVAVFFTATQLIVPAMNNGNSAKEALTNGSGSKAAQGKIVQITQSDSPVTAIAEKVSPSIVGIEVTAGSNGQNFFFDIGQGVGEGSGIIISEDGYILTNNHVIEGALSGNTNKLSANSKIEVILPNMKDKPYTATVVGRDVKSDIAVIKINATGLPKAELGDSSQLKTGELAVAIGNPGGIEYMGSITAGIISGLDRTIQMETGATLNLIQTDAAINPGNSGGALCNSRGQVIGINTVKIAATGFEGLGFAIPINHAKEIAQDLIEFKYVKGRPYLGVQINNQFTADIAKQNNVPEGLLVADVVPLGAAYKAGIKANDIITSFDGVKVTQFSDLENQKNKHKPGDTVNVEIYRDSDKTTKTLKVTLGEDKNE